MEHLYVSIHREVRSHLAKRLKIILDVYTVIDGIQSPYDTSYRIDALLYPVICDCHLLLGHLRVGISKKLGRIERNRSSRERVAYGIMYIPAYPLSFLEPRIHLFLCHLVRQFLAKLTLSKRFQRRHLQSLLIVPAHIGVLGYEMDQEHIYYHGKKKYRLMSYHREHLVM